VHTQLTEASLAVLSAHEGQVLLFLGIELVLEEMLFSVTPLVNCLNRSMDTIQLILL